MCTLEKRGNIFTLTITGSGEHRLNPTLLDSIQSTLRRIRDDPAASSSVLITTAEGKYFSNGYDLAWARSAQSPAVVQSRYQLMSLKLRSVVNDLISLPMPTIAAVTGHAAAGGFMLALSHDYFVMRKDRGFIYMSELDIGMVVPVWFMAMFKCKIGDPNVRREVVLRAAKLTAEMGVARGIVYSAHDGVEATVEAAVRLGKELVGRKWDGHVYAKNRKVVLGDVLDKIGFDETVEEDKAKPVESKL